MKDLSVRWNGILVVLALTTMLGCQALEASKGANQQQQSGSLVLNKATLDFGSVVLGTSKTLAVTLVNSTSSDVTVTGAIIAGSDFSLTSPSLPTTIAGGKSANLTLGFTPHVSGNIASTVEISSDASGPPLTLGLSGAGTPAGQLTASPTSFDFGNIMVGNSLTKTETLINSGGSDLSVSQVLVSGSDFQVSGLSLPLTLASNQSVTFSVTFTPISNGSKSATVSITSDDFVGSRGRRRKSFARANNAVTLTIPLSGNGVMPGQLTATPASLSFGNVQVGSNQTLSETLSNSGSTTVTVSQATATGAGFSISGLALPLTIAAGQSATFTVKFAPQAAGPVTGNIAVVSDASNSPLSVSLTGTGAAPGSLTSAPPSLSFGSVQVGKSQTLSETLTNSGGSTVTITQANVTGAGFSLSGLSLPVTLTAGQSKTFGVVFAPQSAGAVTGNIAVISDASNSTLNIPLSGTGVTPGLLTANPTSLSFGSVQVGSSQTLSETVTNSGGSTVTITQANVTGTGFSLSGLSLPVTLTAGQSKTFSVVFAPQSAGAVTGNVAVVSDASNSTLNIPLSGTGVTPGLLTANPTSLSFGSVQVGSSQTLSETLTNSGGSTVTITQANVTGTGFSLSGLSLPVTLTTGQSKTFSVVFAPQSAGAVTGNIAVISNASNSTLNIPLSGTGVAAGLLTANPTSLSFGSVQVGSSQTLSETVTNSGGSTVTITQANVTGTGFSLSGLSLPVTLTAGQSKTFSAVFAPQSAGAVTGNIAVISNASNSTLNIPLSGTGVAAGLLTANPTSLSFGSVQVGSSQTLSETVTNSGGSTVTITQANVTGTGFSLSGLSLPVTLTAGQSKTFSVVFAPQSAGAVTGNIAVISDASNSTLNIPLSGTGVTAGFITANPSSLSFGSVQVGSSKTLSETLTNSGGSSATITQANVTGSGFSISGLTLPLTLSPGQSFTFGAVFTPTGAGSFSGSISVVSDASNSPLSISMSGTGTAAGQLAVTPTTLDFGSVVVGSSKGLTGTLSATGASVIVSSVSVTSSEFSVSGLSLPVTIAAGLSASFTMTFTPQASGVASATASFISNASNSPTVQSLTGTGTPPQQHSVDLTWDPSNSNDVVGYNIYRGTKSGTYTKINSGLNASTSYTDSSVQSGQTYYYASTAVDSTGKESVYSNEVQAVIPTP